MVSKKDSVFSKDERPKSHETLLPPKDWVGELARPYILTKNAFGGEKGDLITINWNPYSQKFFFSNEVTLVHKNIDAKYERKLEKALKPYKWKIIKSKKKK
jgi:hypothetical protein